jgi:hypothetical protein
MRRRVSTAVTAVYNASRGRPRTCSHPSAAGRRRPRATMLARIGQRAKMPFPIHPHMLRHACGYTLANAGHDRAWSGDLPVELCTMWHRGWYMSRKLELVREEKLFRLLPGRKESSRL